MSRDAHVALQVPTSLRFKTWGYVRAAPSQATTVIVVCLCLTHVGAREDWRVSHWGFMRAIHRPSEFTMPHVTTLQSSAHSPT